MQVCYNHKHVIIEIGGQMKHGKNHKIWEIGVYIRLSKDDGNDESLSVTNQKKITAEYIERVFTGIEYRIVDYYVDDGVSGTSHNRPDFQRMIDNVESRTLNCIVTKTLSRAFRNYSDQGYYLEQIFPTYGLRFISISGPELDTYLNPNAILDGFEVPITGVMNDRFAARTSQDVRKTFDMKRRNGEYIGAFAPFGYQKNPENKNHLIIDDEAAEVVRNIFNWYVNEGMSISGIVRHLNELGILSPIAYKHSKGLNHQVPRIDLYNGDWSDRTVGVILSNRQYLGTMVQGKQEVISYKVKKKVIKNEDDWYVVEGTHDPIIDQGLFDKAQDIRQTNTRVPKGKKQLYLFSGFLRCPDCGKSMTIKNNRKKNKDGQVMGHQYYVCTTYATRNKKACTRHTIRVDRLSEAVLEIIKKKIALIGNMSEVIAEVNKMKVINTQSTILKQRLSDKKAEIKKATHVADSLYEDWKLGILTKEKYIRMQVNFDEKIEEMKKVQGHIENEIASLANGVGEDDPYLLTFLQYKNIEKLERSLLVDLVDTIYIHEQESDKPQEITIKFKFSNEHQRVSEFIANNSESLTIK